MNEAAAAAVRTTCAYCGVGCGMRVTPTPTGGFEVTGDPEHPANQGRLCAKGAALGETLSGEDRLLHPEMDGRRVSWDAALARVADGFAETIARYGPDAVAFYVSGQLLSEDYYVANKLMKGFIGSANIDTNSRLCMASSVAGHKRAFGEDVVPGVYEDFELADLVVLIGSNLAWCHPVLHQRLLAARAARGTRIVVIDPRATASTVDADLHLALAAGSDVALFNGLLHHLAASDALDEAYVAAHTTGFEAALAAARAFDLARVCRETGLARADVTLFYELFTRHRRTLSVYSQGVNQSRAGTDKVNAIINCHLATGRIGQPGAGPFSVTGQPNAMGGRETGGLANMLAAHLDLEDPLQRRSVQRFWNAPRIATRPGLKAVDLFRAVASGEIRALWVMATNPLVSMPDADAVRAALARCPLVVVSDITRRTDTAAAAHVLLPAAGWGEKDGTVTNSERCVSRQRAFTAAPGEARPDWWALAGVARRMGFGAAFDYNGAHEIYREYAALTALARHHGRVLDLARDADLDAAGYAALQPRQWPLGAADEAPARLFGDGRFATPDGRARFVVTPYLAPRARTDARHPLLLNTGRVRDQWHTMTRSGRAARLCSHIAEPQVDLHPRTARECGVATADLALLEHAGGRAVVRVAVTERQAPGTLFMPMHWSAATSSAARVNVLVPAVTDPVSGQPELKAATVSLRRFAARWYGFAVLTREPTLPQLAYWARMRAPRGWRVELADDAPHTDFDALFRDLLGESVPDLALLDYVDAARGARRLAAFDGERLVGALFVAPGPVAVQRSWACERLGLAHDARERAALLAGFPGGERAATGSIVCSCEQVGSSVIRAAIVDGHVTPAAVGCATAAGTNCGSCRPEIQRLIDELSVRDAV